MSVILCLLVCLAPRPEPAPVTGADVALALRLEREFESGPVRPVLPDDREQMKAGRFTVGYEPGQAEAARQWVSAIGGRVVREDADGCFLVIAQEGGDAAVLSSRAAVEPGLRYVEPEYRVRASLLPNDPFFLSDQWDKWVMYADKAWDVTTGSQAVKIGVVDNGVEYSHPDLAANFDPGEPGRDFIGGDNDPRPDNPAEAEAFHGTHVSGICAGVLNNGIGVAGWANARLYAVRVLDDSGSGNTSDLATGIRWAADNGCRIINMSLGADAAPTDVIEACRYAAGRGVLLVAAAGNAGTSPVQYPAGLPECVCVGATNELSGLAGFSNYGSAQEVVAPGTDVLSTWVGGNLGFASGTSMACPEVTGVAALVMAANPGLTAQRARAVLAASCIDKGLPGRDERFGYGMVNAARAVELASLLARDGGETPAAEPGSVREVVRGSFPVPGWCREASVFSVSGRLVARGPGPELALEPGTWFIRLASGSRQEMVKAVVLP